MLGMAVAARPLAADAPVLTLHLPGLSQPLTRAALLALPQQHYATATIWTEGVSVFAGPSLWDVLAAHGVPLDKADQIDLRLTALNGYHVEMPLAAVTQAVPLLALTRDGVALTARDKGPVWVIYPYDADPRWRSEVIYARSIWQLHDITVLPRVAED